MYNRHYDSNGPWDTEREAFQIFKDAIYRALVIFAVVQFLTAVLFAHFLLLFLKII